MMMLPRAPLITLAAALILTACQQADAPVAVADDPHAGIDLPPGHPAVDLPGDSKAAAPDAAGHTPMVALDGEGLRLFDPPSGVSRALAFGTSEAQLKSVLEKLKGKAETGRNEECGVGPLAYLSWPDGLTLYVLDGLFAGWSLDDRGAALVPAKVPAKAAKASSPAKLTTAKLTTATGIGIGSTREALTKAYNAKIEQTTLGTEFNAAGLSGILDGTGPKAKVTNLWSGVNCVFR
ncbi:hypothetical protein [Blastomonas sp.]|uniref:hypothetical protein n=1 Tax=Blastomonas sp. TaxID=1909299 RepID=UPI003593373A